jgi:HNH endonuclease/NUMOD4 motif
MRADWRAIADYEGYEVSSDGCVRALLRIIQIGPSHDGRKAHERGQAGRVLRLQRHQNGYLWVKLPPGITVSVHRLVCRAFNGEPPAPNCHAHHINQRPDDNRAENLCWLEPEANRAVRRIARGEQHGRHKLTANQVKDIRARLKGRRGKVTSFDVMIAAEYSVSRETIRNIRRDQTWYEAPA